MARPPQWTPIMIVPSRDQHKCPRPTQNVPFHGLKLKEGTIRSVPGPPVDGKGHGSPYVAEISPGL
jgi:hypothetical protein